MHRLRILFMVNIDSFLVSHRIEIVKKAIREGYEVHVACAVSEAAEELRACGCIVHPVNIERSGTNPINELHTFVSVYRVIKRVAPDLIHAITIKPVLYGGIAARLQRKRMVAAIPGLGYTFLRTGVRAYLVKLVVVFLYRAALVRAKVQAIVQNLADQQFVIKQVGVHSSRVHLIPGSGVDLSQYQVSPEPEGGVTFVMASRLLKDKGVMEYIGAARLVKAKNPYTRFWLAGSPDLGNPSSIQSDFLEKVRDEGIVEILGFQTNMAALLGTCNVVVLPSYREGLPKVLIEAAACGRAVITTSVPGCSDAIIDGGTGLLVPPRDTHKLAIAMERLAENATLRGIMGMAGRELAERLFCVDHVVQQHLTIYRCALETRARG